MKPHSNVARKIRLRATASIGAKAPPTACRQGSSLSRPDLFTTAAAIARSIPSGKARHDARDGWLDRVKTDKRLKRHMAAKLAAQVLAQNLRWKSGYVRMSNQEIADAMGAVRSTAMRGIWQLHDKGHIARKIDKRGDTKENDKASTALVGLKDVGAPCTHVGAGTTLRGCGSAPDVGAGVHLNEFLSPL